MANKQSKLKKPESPKYKTSDLIKEYPSLLSADERFHPKDLRTAGKKLNRKKPEDSKQDDAS